MQRPAMLYGYENTLTQENKQQQDIFERKVLKIIHGPVKNSEGDYRMRYNSKLKAFFRVPNIVAVVKINRLQWTGHIERMKEDYLMHKILQGYLKNIGADLVEADVTK